MAEDIRQSVTFNAKPAVIYRALVDAKQHAAFTGSPATSDPRQGGAFTAWGGYIVGYHAELVKGARIVQAWRASDWPAGAWSIARFELKPAGTGQTRLTFTQSGVPAANLKSITEGWKVHYWTPLAAWLERKNRRAQAASSTKKKPKKK
jgi:activator of HSP90 ATPase